MGFVSNTFETSNFLTDINATLVVLIPKIDSPENLSQFLLISLCNVLYKVITKVLANRMKHILSYIIIDGQSSFIPNRSITDNIIIVQEILHSKRRKNGEKAMAIKIDLHKVNDILSWPFIKDTLRVIGFIGNFIWLTMFCVSLVSMQILWNGWPTPQFFPSRGVRQGDPISPYLFVLCVEILAHAIRISSLNGTWALIQIEREVPFISYLFFADGLLLLFTKASRNSVLTVNKVLSNGEQA